MTKTMQSLISRAQQNTSRPNIGLVQRTCGSGAQGGRINHGMRESQALHQLLKLGMVEIVGQHKSAIASAGHTLWIYDTTYQVL
jgi:hypothetical protein